MKPATMQPVPHAAPKPAPIAIGCVSFLNAKPLIAGLDDGADPRVKFDVPSRLLQDLESGAVDIALCPVIDFQRSSTPLAIVPVGGIGCDGPTLTVRLYSRTPIATLTEVHVDTDSHTSITLLRVLLAEMHGLRPKIIDYAAPPDGAGQPAAVQPSAMLLIGDKVITSAPPTEQYPHQMDLGEAWKQLTGLPFVFAVWMARRGTRLGALPRRLDMARRANASKVEAIVRQHAPALGWPRDLARTYLGQWLKYEIGPRQLEAIDLFYRKAHRHGIIESLRPIEIHGDELV